MHTEYLEIGDNTPILKGLQFSIIKTTNKTTNHPPNGTTCPRNFLQVVGELNIIRFPLRLTQ